MASYAAEHAPSPDVASLAANMNSGQASEIGYMQDLLAERGWAAEPGAASTGDAPVDPDAPATHSDH